MIPQRSFLKLELQIEFVFKGQNLWIRDRVSKHFKILYSYLNSKCCNHMKDISPILLPGPSVELACVPGSLSWGAILALDNIRKSDIMFDMNAFVVHQIRCDSLNILYFHTHPENTWKLYGLLLLLLWNKKNVFTFQLPLDTALKTAPLPLLADLCFGSALKLP